MVGGLPVIAVYSDTGTKLISYRYDAWGNRTTTYSNGGASTLAANNRITYRGYYYDADLGMYYLQSRYYDAKICRFINADGYISTGQGLTGYNMFAYCGNDPVNRVDPTGNIWRLVLAVVLIAGVVLLTGCSQQESVDAANEKYNSETININGNNPNGIISVTIDESGEKIHIEDSYKISNPLEQTAILTTIANSDEYKSDYKDINAMRIEWSGHNFIYRITRCSTINNIVSNLLNKDNANSSAKDVDINENDPFQGWYEFLTLGGLVSW